jgi:hypothetical protein
MSEHHVDARVPRTEVVPALPRLGGTNPHGDSIALTNESLTFNGRPWYAVAGEIHYARLPRERWKDALLGMKAGGVDIAASYVFWIHHEEQQGRFEWNGNRDLRHFVELCGEAGIFAIIRVGPFCHGEVRNGGMPDWLYGRPFPLRSNDPRYLALVRRLYDEIGRQLKGLFFRDGGPIIGIQLENELMHAGAPWETTPRLCTEWVTAGTGGAEHLRALKEIARESGLEAPLLTSTAWGGAPVLEGEVLPLYGGYAFCPWNVTESTPVHSPTREYTFRNFRGNGRRDALFDPPYDPSTVPFACCEMGGGMQSWYRYRFVVPAQSVEAMALVKIAGGCSMLGYYMYHGGSNPVGKSGFLNEHIVPRISYDFQAPLGEFGQQRESYLRLRRLHRFFHDFAPQLSATGTALPKGAEEIDPKDVDTLRFAARVRGKSGFLFLNNYQDHVETREVRDVSVVIALPGEGLRIPRTGGFTLARDDCAVMPFNLEMNGILLVYATAQPIARLEVDGELHIFFFAHDSIPAEYCVSAKTCTGLEAPGSTTDTRDGCRYVQAPRGHRSALTLRAANGGRTVVHTLTESESLRFAVHHLWGRDRAIITSAEAIPEPESLTLRFRDEDPGTLELSIFPGLKGPLAADGQTLKPGDSSGFTSYEVHVDARKIHLEVNQPGDGEAEIQVPEKAFEGVRDVLLRVEYDGDVGNAFVDGRLIADDFCNGTPWVIALDRFRSDLAGKGIYLHVSPRRDGTMVVRESGMAVQQELKGTSVARISSISAMPEREVTLRLAE